MNTLKTKFSVLILILALTFGNEAKAEKDSVSPDKKETVRLKLYAPLLTYILEYFDVDDIIALVVIEHHEDFESLQLAGWIFADLFTEEESLPMEDWMFKELVSPEEEITLEDWMFDLDYYEEEVIIEDWMLDTEYYSKKE